MHAAAVFEFTLLLIGAILVLHLVAVRLRLPPAAALITGGIALAFVPGVPAITLDPELVLVLFLPPLLMDGAYSTVLSDFRRHLPGILSLAVGAVAFTTLVVGVVAHWLVPALPWAACFALGAVVSPPDAVAAKAVLESVRLPRTLVVLLEGESLLNDAAGLVLFRFAVAAAMTGLFDAGEAGLTFGVLALGGVVVGAAFGFVWVRTLRLLREPPLMIAASFLLCWASYIGGEALHVSGVISTVTAGLVFGWHQHVVFPAAVRLRGTAAWGVMVFLLEALVFILIGLSLRGVIGRLGGVEAAVASLAAPVLAIVATVVAARFAWVFASDGVRMLYARISGRAVLPFSWASSAVLGWAGMRGVVTLAIALSVPEGMPGRDLILATAFAVILATVLLQGTTMGVAIRLVGLRDDVMRAAGHLSRAQAAAAMVAAQHAAVKERAYGEDGTLLHPRLLEQYGHRAQVVARFSEAEETYRADRAAHFEVLLSAIAAGRQELLRMHRAGHIHDEVLHSLEQSLDLQEIAADVARG